MQPVIERVKKLLNLAADDNEKFTWRIGRIAKNLAGEINIAREFFVRIGIC